MQETRTYIIDDGQYSLLVGLIDQLGFEGVPIKGDYEKARYRTNGTTLIMYKSGKAVLQGKDLQKTEDMMSEVGILSNSNGYSPDPHSNLAIDLSGRPRIGSDEVGKGDYFGPLVVASCYLDQKTEGELKKCGIVDSKKRNDEEILDIFSSFYKKVKYTVEVVSPDLYNSENSRLKNASILLAQAHSRCIDKLVGEIEKEKKDLEIIVIDQFSSQKSRITNELTDKTKKYEVIQFHKGESDMAVAAASIIARTYFLKEWDDMEKKFKMNFPKGATNVINSGKDFVDKFSAEQLNDVAKTSFRTTGQILN